MDGRPVTPHDIDKAFRVAQANVEASAEMVAAIQANPGPIGTIAALQVMSRNDDRIRSILREQPPGTPPAVDAIEVSRFTRRAGGGVVAFEVRRRAAEGSPPAPDGAETGGSGQ